MRDKLLFLCFAFIVTHAFGQTTQVASGNTKTQDNQYLIAQLDTIHQEDQDYRIQVGELQKKYAQDSREMRDMWKKIQQKDSVNLIKVSKILNERGWLGADVIGEQGNQTLFLVIQHSNQATQEKYLPVMREAVRKGNARASHLALLEDRVAMGQGKKQLYGSQLRMDKETNSWVVYPMVDPDNLDKRRASVELDPMADYVTNFQIKWDLEQYKKNLPKLEKLFNLH